MQINDPAVFPSTELTHAMSFSSREGKSGIHPHLGAHEELKDPLTGTQANLFHKKVTAEQADKTITAQIEETPLPIPHLLPGLSIVRQQ